MFVFCLAFSLCGLESEVLFLILGLVFVLGCKFAVVMEYVVLEVGV